MLLQSQEERVLQLAIEKGVISTDILMSISKIDCTGSTRKIEDIKWGIKIDKLLNKGYLDDKIIENLLEEQASKEIQKSSDSISPTLLEVFKIKRSSAKDSNKHQMFPVSGWEKYEFIRLIGMGGMGKVYQAKDTKLKRYVALKFLLSNDLEMAERFLQEAQAQARIQHPNVCKVYEVGEVEGNPYIAMQYIEGLSLKEIKSHITLEQKVTVIKQVAEALQAAHRLGLIHRDIKPANIMLEKQEDGSYQPYIMDFGLVKDLGQKGETITGAILGTPAYMSPEQARGDVNLLDRRTDIYSLGATLYDLLTGKSPYDASKGHTILIKIYSEDPEPLRKYFPNIPIDLEAIVMKCLERESKERYESAKALADDLVCYLEGEPVKARKVSKIYLAKRKLKRHKAVVAISSFTVLLTMTFVFVAIYQKFQYDQKTKLAQEFGQEIKEIDGYLQRAYLLPPHDTKQERQTIQNKIKKISQDIKNLGQLAQGPGNYAIGRGYLALHKYELARLYLDKAWQSGEQSSQTAYSLGLAFGELYKKALEELNNSLEKDPRVLKVKREEIEKIFRNSALFYLKESKKGVQLSVSSSYLEGLIAFYDKNYPLALEKSQQAFKENLGFYEAKKLEGDIFLLQADIKRQQNDYKGAEEDLKMAEDAYQMTIDIARSDPSVYLSECNRQAALIVMKLEKGLPYEEEIIKISSFYSKTLALDSENLDIYLEQLQLITQASETSSEEILKILKEKELLVDRAIELAIQESLVSETSSSYNKLGQVYYFKANSLLKNSLYPVGFYDKALKSYQKSLQLNPKFIDTYQSLHNVLMDKAKYEQGQGENPIPTLEIAIDYCQKLLEIQPNFYATHSDLSQIYFMIGRYKTIKKQDPTESFEKAIFSSQKCLQLNPSFVKGYALLGNACLSKAEYELNLPNIDPTNSFNTARKNYKMAIELDKEYLFMYMNIGYAWFRQAQYEIKIHKNPTNALNASIEAYKKVLETNPKNPEALFRMKALNIMKKQTFS